MKSFFTITNSILFLAIAILVLSNVALLKRTNALEQAAITVMYVAEIRSALAVHKAELGVYPQGDESILGAQETKVLCVGATPEGRSGFLSSESLCEGNVVMQLDRSRSAKPLTYFRGGSAYSIEFILPSPFGAFKNAGIYCATEKGIAMGKCDR